LKTLLSVHLTGNKVHRFVEEHMLPARRMTFWFYGRELENDHTLDGRSVGDWMTLAVMKDGTGKGAGIWDETKRKLKEIEGVERAFEVERKRRRRIEKEGL